ncbi:MAG: dihydroxyacetone kinase subunit DhaL [Desemzia incerta]|uniref:phosphoenolpyruvate--glycerone phosphotransferase n=1 Tax=Desemzia incerta TaxID=82801 RepID=A0A1I5X9V4_9LACT|nr:MULTISPECIES: dihydroxyacetone kinase subunit DhaL [Desemzia]MCI3028675.1 dihydroxyacetone kinase subunit L [Desemzia sp. C1]WHZ32804.1 dihydroxyacetone kinase subunit DhaL [Desemzia incerta]SFQ28427.1 dihydroxyacetone kinase DhaL subunit [Desemzia incerta]
MLSVETVTKWMELFGEQLTENKTYLSELDTAIGDGDHGNNLARGAAALKEKLGANEYEALTDLLKDVGMVFVSKIGGASGPLYGSAFISMAKASKDNDSLELADLLAAGLDGIQKRGKAEAGEKTMVDEWVPVVEAVKNNSLTTETIEEAVEKTKDMKATKGRASYLGDRSIGHLDPGAMSSSLLFKTMLEAGVYDGK